MDMNERIRILLEAAQRADREGSPRIAQVLRIMAEDARPLPLTLNGGPAETVLGT